MNKVWVLSYCENYEGCRIEGVYDTKEKADQARGKDHGCMYYQIEEWIIK